MDRKPCLRRTFNNRMNRLGAATFGLGLCSMAIVSAGTFWLVGVWCFLQGLCVGAIDAIANVAINDVHGAGAAPWVQGLHFFFSFGALVAPAAVGELGYRKVFAAFGVLAIPASLACCLAEGANGDSDTDSGWFLEGSGPGILLEESYRTTLSTDVTLTASEDDMETLEAPFTCIRHNRRAAGGQRLSYGSLFSKAGPESLQEDEEEELTSVSPSTDILSTIHITEHGQGNQLATLPGAAALSIADNKFGTQQPEECTVDEHLRLSASPPDIKTNEARYLLTEHHAQQSGRDYLPPQNRGEGSLPPASLVVLLALFLFLCVGVEVGFGAWVAVVVLRDDLSGETGAIRMASLFWGGVTVGRLLAVPLAVRFSTSFLVRANLLGCLLSSVLLLLAGRVSFVWVALGAGLLGLFMASTYPLAISLLPSAGFLLSDKNSSRMVVGGAMGEMLVPALIAALLGPDDGGWPAALYSVCVAVSVLLVIVYGACCSQLKAAGRQVGQGQG